MEQYVSAVSAQNTRERIHCAYEYPFNADRRYVEYLARIIYVFDGVFTTAAEQCGFSSANSFIRALRTRYGSTSASFRRSGGTETD